MRYFHGLALAALLPLAACGGGGDTAGDADTATADTSPADAFGSDSAGGNADRPEGEQVIPGLTEARIWARQIRTVCVGEMGQEYQEQCRCMSERLTEGRTVAEITGVTDEQRREAFAACG